MKKIKLLRKEYVVMERDAFTRKIIEIMSELQVSEYEMEKILKFGKMDEDSKFEVRGTKTSLWKVRKILEHLLKEI